MAKVGILLPAENMRQDALELLETIPLDVVCCRTIRTEDTINEARRAVEEGAQVIIARGYQAKIIKECTKIPLVEIRFTGQEVGLFLQRAKEIAGKPHPHVALIAFENMLPDMTYFAQLMDVELTISFIKKMELVGGTLKEYEKNRPDVVVGGEITCAAAREMGYLTVFYQSTPESVAEAMRTARRVSYAMDAEQQHAARFETVLDSSFNAILQVNQEQIVLSMNRSAQDLFGCSEEEAVGRPASSLLTGVDLQPLERVLSGERGSITTTTGYKKEAFMLLISPIRYDGRVTGAVLSFRQLSAVSSLSRQAKRDLLISGYQTSVTFRDIMTRDPQFRKMLDLAEVFALSESPLLLYEEEGNEAAMIARAVHNNSTRKAGPFVSLDVRDLLPEEQVDALLRRGAGMEEDLPQDSIGQETGRPGAGATQAGRRYSTGNAREALNRGNIPGRGNGDRSSFVTGTTLVSGNSPESDRLSFGTGGSKAIGALVRANSGTLFINCIEKLTLQAQHQLLRTLLPWAYMHTDARPVDTLDVRIIACAKQNLLPAVEAETFSPELYYHFSSFALEIPPLERRPEDLRQVFRSRIEKYASRYHRHLQLTEEGLRAAVGLRWKGGFTQVDTFCERLVLTSTKRRIAEPVILTLYKTLYPEARRVQGASRLVVYDAPQAQQIRELLKKHKGDREAVARELGISKTTLWRHMKKYNVTAKYDE